ncbi:MAG: T9SS type A sorting domain-containing protein [Chloroflexota bacterium]
MFKFLDLLFATGFSAVLFAGSAFAAGEINEIKLPAERISTIQKAVPATKTNIKADKLLSDGGKVIIRDPSTGSPRRILDKPEKIQGFPKINDNNVEAAARAFLKSKENELTLKNIELNLRRKTHVNGRWYVTFDQVYKGVDVLLTEVELRIFDNGNVALYGADVIPNINIDVNPTLSYDAAVNKINKEVEGKGSVDKLQRSSTPFILPIKTSSGVVCKLVWRAEIVNALGRRYVNYIDANAGASIWRFEMSRSSHNTINSKGSVRLNTPMDTLSEVAFKDILLLVNGEEFYSDNDGITSVDHDADLSVLASLSGKYASVNLMNTTRSNGTISTTLLAGKPLNLLWNDDNSNIYERSLYCYANAIHSDLKSIDPEIDVMDFPISLIVDFSTQNSPNAYSAGESIHFLAVDNPEVNMGESSSILYHEYTHSINGLLYKELGLQDGMVNASANEGMADVYSCLIQGQPMVGLKSFKNDSTKYIRNIENNCVYPDSLNFDSHYNGQILSGAFWDLAKLTSKDFVKKLSHFVKYGTPDDPDLGKAYMEWFLETLIADDDDGNLANGTPHSTDIITAFNKHHIGTDLIMAQSFVHEPLADTQDTINAQAVYFLLSASNLPNSGVAKAEVVYTTDNWEHSFTAPAQADDDGIYLATIPAMPAGTYLKYYIQGSESLSGRDINLNKELLGKDYYEQLIGYRTSQMDRCESLGGWSIGDAQVDTVVNGKWECAAPGLVDLSVITGGFFGLFQPGKDHSETGTKCFVTDPEGISLNNFSEFPSHMLIGISTIYSPIISMKELKKPLLRFWLFATLQQYSYAGAKPKLELYYYTDKGGSWKLASAYKHSTEDWISSTIDIDALADGAESIRFKFVASNPGDLEEGMINFCEALIDDFEILTVNTINSAQDVNAGNTLSVYPNPAADYVRIESGEPGRITITDALGVNKYEASAVAGSNNVDLSALPAGVYFVRLSNANGINLGKFVKK